MVERINVDPALRFYGINDEFFESWVPLVEAYVQQLKYGCPKRAEVLLQWIIDDALLSKEQTEQYQDLNETGSVNVLEMIEEYL